MGRRRKVTRPQRDGPERRTPLHLPVPPRLAEAVDARLRAVAAALPPEQGREMTQIARAQAAAAAETLREGRTVETLRYLAETTAAFARNAGDRLLPMFPPEGP